MATPALGSLSDDGSARFGGGDIEGGAEGRVFEGGAARFTEPDG